MQEQSNKQFYISDWHYGHANVIAFDNRPFKSLLEMDEALVDRWNAVVSPGDIVYVLGDMFWCKAQDASGESGIELSASVDGTAKKYEAIQSTVEILAGITEKITQFMAPEKGGILLSAAATPILKRHRLLNEMDADTLLTYDDMALEDIDYIIL